MSECKPSKPSEEQQTIRGPRGFHIRDADFAAITLPEAQEALKGSV